MWMRANKKYVPGNPLQKPKSWTISFGVASLFPTSFIVGALVSVEFAEGSGMNRAWSYEILGAIFLMCILGIPYGLNTLITFESQGLTYRNFWRKTYDIPYASITQYGLERRLGETALAIYTAEKKYLIPELIGFWYLREQLRENVGEEKEKSTTFLDYDR